MNPQAPHKNFDNAYRNFQSGKFDANASTFRHEINLKPTEKVPVIKGYSASVGTREAVKKVYVFTSCYYRILPKYLHKSISILVYKRHDLTQGWSKQNETLICRITPLGVETYVDEHTPVETTLGEMFDNPFAWLNKLILHIEDKDCVAKLQPKRVQPSKMEKYYAELLRNKAFNTLDEVTAYCKNRIAEGEARGVMQDFWREYRDAYFLENLPTQPPQESQETPKVQNEPSTTTLEKVAAFGESVKEVILLSNRAFPTIEQEVSDEEVLQALTFELMQDNMSFQDARSQAVMISKTSAFATIKQNYYAKKQEEGLLKGGRRV
jgi:hypothetical protein